MSRGLGFSFGHGKGNSLEHVSLLKVRKDLACRRASISSGILWIRLYASIQIFINSLPSGCLYDVSVGREQLLTGPYGDLRLLIFTGRVQDCQEAAYHQVIDPPLVDGHMGQVHKLLCGDDGVMVRYLLIIHKGGLCRQRLVYEPSRQDPVRAHGACL